MKLRLLLPAALALLGGCQPGVELPMPAASAAQNALPGAAAVAAAVQARLATDAELAGLNLHVEVVSGRVRLRGVAPNTALRAHISALAHEVASVEAGAVEIVNEVSVQRRPS